MDHSRRSSPALKGAPNHHLSKGPCVPTTTNHSPLLHLEHRKQQEQRHHWDQLVSVVRTPSPQQTATWRPPAPDPAVNDAGEGSLPQITPLDLTVVAMEGGDIKTRSRGQSPLGKSDAFTHAKEASELSSSHESHSEDGADEGIPQVEAASPALAGNVRDNALYGDAANQDTAAGCNPDDCRHGDLHGRGMNSLYGNDLYEAHDCISGWDTANIAALAGSAPNNKVQKQQQLLQLPQPTQEKQSAQLLRLHRPLQQRRLQQQQQHNQQQEQLQQLRLHLQQERQRKRVQLQLQQQQLRLEIQQQLQQMKQQKQQRRQRQRLYRQQLLQQKGQGQEHEQKDLAADKVLFLERQQPQQREEQQTPNPNSKQQRQQQQQTCEFLKRQRPQCTSNVPNDTRKLRQHFMWSTMSSRAKFPKSASFKSKERGPVEVHHLYMGSSYVKSYRCLKLRGSV
ncbi:hypothetical protein Vafri_20484 [Volvox africanus]|uniref:Uncharacterized protein n=1 Tax=Volvox africanus TaxID=51714 RepID=A0A8J4FE01_9CHLO|nr:hypothetical protein Vafri_20484 [Volvox africanus]